MGQKELINPFETSRKEILEVSDRLWITFTFSNKTSELARFFISNKGIKIIYTKAEFISSQKQNTSFAISQSYQNRDGENLAVDFSAHGITDHLIVQICVDTNGLLKGDSITFYSSFPEFIFKNIKVEKYRPNSNLEIILEKSDVVNGSSFYLTWPWR